MNHNVRTAKRDYFLVEKMKKVGTTGAFVQKMILDKELLKHIGDEKVNTKSIRQLKLENPGLECFLEKLTIHR